MPYSPGEGLACNLAKLMHPGQRVRGGGKPAPTIGIPSATLAGNNCHQFAGRRGHAFHVVHASAVLRVYASPGDPEEARGTSAFFREV